MILRVIPLSIVLMLAPLLLPAWADHGHSLFTGSIPAALLAQDTTAAKPFTCCYGGMTTDGCDQSSPNLIGCEFALAYRCRADKYTCDPEKQTCSCPTPSGDTAESTQ